MASPGTVHVANGNYYESNIAITKSMSVIGESQAGVVIGPSMADGHVDSTFGGTISNGFLLQSGSVTIQSLTLDGNAGGTGVTGDHNYRAGIITDHRTGSLYNAITVQNVTVQHTWRRGIQLLSKPGTRSSGSPMAATVSYKGSICERMSSGIGARCALY